MKRLLKLTGAICVHLDWHAAHYVKVEMDKIFGYDLFRNEIVWHYESGGRSSKRFTRKHDVILWYSKTDNYFFDPKAVGVPRNHCELCGSVLEKWNNLKRHVDDDGRVYRTIKSAGKIYKYYDDDPVAPSDVWLGINHLQQKDPERIGYPTQKPERLLDRIIEATTKPDDVVADFF
jgi:adenine-specific DNA-methyltransferase